MVQEEIPPPPPPPPPPPSPFGYELYRTPNGTKMDNEEAAPPRQAHNQNVKNMVKEEVAPPPPPPPPPPPFGYGRYHNRNSKNMDKEEVTPPRRARNDKKMDNEEVATPRRARNGKKIDNKEVAPPRRPHNGNNKKMEKEEVSSSPPPLGIGRYHNQNGKKMNNKKVSLPSRHLQLKKKNHKKMEKEEVSSPLLMRKNSNPPTLPKKNPRCPASHPAHPHTLCPRFGGNTNSGCFSCGGYTSPLTEDQNYHFFCQTCDVEFHRVCHMFPRKLTHPYHLQHPLTFTFRNYETGFISDGSIDESFCTTFLCGSNMYDPTKFGSIESDKCTWCGKNIQGNWFYRCSICNFCLDLHCSQTIPLLHVTTPKNHHHPLVLYKRPLLTPCDACGLVNVLDPSYACFECNYMVHQSCINLPRVIKITRHQHRIFHTPCLQTKISPCGVCYQTVDTKDGQYSCNNEDCSYVVHSKCATNENVWDGKELEKEPEESDEIEDILPFKMFGDDLIKHFSHEHLLKLEKYDGVRDAEKQCQACILPMDSRDFYNYTHCDFFLHKVCAGLLRKLSHALHKHPLILETSPRTHYDFIDCKACSRKSTGFRYICPKSICVCEQVQIDVRCISSVPDYFTHESHEHPLFISTSSKGQNKTCCVGCKKIGMRSSYLQCTICKFAMCYQCARYDSN